MKTKCYSVRLKSLVSISEKAFKAQAFDGTEAIIPSSQIFSQDSSVVNSDAYWISAWILEKKSLQYSTRKVGWFDSKTKKIEPNYTYEVSRHTPKRKQPVEKSVSPSLKR